MCISAPPSTGSHSSAGPASTHRAVQLLEPRRNLPVPQPPQHSQLGDQLSPRTCLLGFPVVDRLGADPEELTEVRRRKINPGTLCVESLRGKAIDSAQFHGFFLVESIRARTPLRDSLRLERLRPQQSPCITAGRTTTTATSAISTAVGP